MSHWQVGVEGRPAGEPRAAAAGPRTNGGSPLSTLLLNDDEVRQLVDQATLVDGIEAALQAESAGGAVVPPRMNLEHASTWLRVMPALVPSEGVMGLKVFHGTPGGGVRYLITLYDVIDGEVLAILDACYLTAARTAATSAVASRYLTDGSPVRLGVIGSGLEAQTHCEALAAVKELTEIKVFSPSEERRRAFARRMEAVLGVPAYACARPEEAVESADEVVVATNTGPAKTIACRAEWLRPSQLVLAIGSTNPNLRELDTQVLHRAETLVFDADPVQIAEESADVMEYSAEGGSLESVVTLPSLLANGRGQGWGSGLTVFKSVGTALQDVAAAAVVYRRAMELGAGTDVPQLCSPKVFLRSSQPRP